MDGCEAGPWGRPMERTGAGNAKAPRPAAHGRAGRGPSGLRAGRTAMMAIAVSPSLFFAPWGLTALAQMQPAGSAWGYIAGALVVWLVTTVLTWLIATRITTAVLREQTGQLREGLDRVSDELEGLQGGVRGLQANFNTLQNERTQCELRAVQRYATREEFAHTLVQAAANHREAMGKLDQIAAGVRESVGKVHGRVDDVAERVTRVEERTPSDER